jgi:hypothetical protein
MSTDLNPDDLLAKMREICRTSGRTGRLPDEEEIEFFFNMFDSLDAWLSNRGKLPAAWRRVVDSPDWTTADGITNSSAEFLKLKGEVHRLICNSAFDLINGRVEAVAGLILARLAHAHGLGPTGSK